MAGEPEKVDTVRKRSIQEVGPGEDIIVTITGEIVNASGHKDQLQRQYGLLSICGLALTVDNAWVALGTSLAVSICRSTGSCISPNPTRIF